MPEEVAERVERCSTSPSPVVTIPRWRGGFVRFFDAFPGLAVRLAPLVMRDALAGRRPLQAEARAPGRVSHRLARASPRPRRTARGAARRRFHSARGTMPLSGLASLPGRTAARALGGAAGAPLDRPGGDRLASAQRIRSDWSVLELGLRPLDRLVRAAAPGRVLSLRGQRVLARSGRASASPRRGSTTSSCASSRWRASPPRSRRLEDDSLRPGRRRLPRGAGGRPGRRGPAGAREGAPRRLPAARRLRPPRLRRGLRAARGLARAPLRRGQGRVARRSVRPRSSSGRTRRVPQIEEGP